MRFSTFSSGLALAVACMAANAATLVTLNPSGQGIDPTGSPFQTTGGSLFLGQTGNPAPSQTILQIFGTSGPGVNYSETGRIFVEAFRNSTIGPAPLSIPNFNAYPSAGEWGVYIDFTLTGTGNWALPLNSPAGGFFVATSANLSATMFATNTAGGTVNLGSLALIGAATATAATFGGPTTGTANSGFSGVAQFLPNAGTTGPGNFFQAPVPFDIAIALGNVGGNTFNTGWSVSGNTVTVVVPIDGAGTSGTGNFEFRRGVIPAPASLALVALGLIAAGVATRRSPKATQKV